MVVCKIQFVLLAKWAYEKNKLYSSDGFIAQFYIDRS